jgi:DNA-directed RNA polymerase subunit K/omega
MAVLLSIPTMEASEILDSQKPEGPVVPQEPAPPIHSRFLFVDVAAMRAKQLKRGAMSRLDSDESASTRVGPLKAERVAIEEVSRGLVHYDIPAPKGAGQGD